MSFLFDPQHTRTQLYNAGPSSVSGTVLEVGWPSRHQDEHLLYAMEISTDGPIQCHINGTLNPLELEVTHTHLIELQTRFCPEKITINHILSH